MTIVHFREVGARTPIIILLLLSWTTLVWASPAVVIAPLANMYSAPNENADLVSQAIYGSNVELLEATTDWTKVETEDQYSGWMRFRDLLRWPASDPGYATSGEVAEVSSSLANVYREPDVTAHPPLLMVSFETRLEVLPHGQGKNSEWLQVRLPDQRSAWILMGDGEPATRRLTIPESIALARRFSGLTYTWGGRSIFGYDCSGFTQMLVRSRGINMPRDADLQAAWKGAFPITRKQLRAGDLLFFGDSPAQITHTGMFIGKGRFIHDRTYGHPGVQISRLREEPWTRLLVACRRIR